MKPIKKNIKDKKVVGIQPNKPISKPASPVVANGRGVKPEKATKEIRPTRIGKPAQGPRPPSVGGRTVGTRTGMASRPAMGSRRGKRSKLSPF